jgi:hypothetical protein
MVRQAWGAQMKGDAMVRQGDVLLIKVARILKTAVKQSKCVLALGEATGHAHQILEGAYLLQDTDGTKYVEVIGDTAMVVHEEHEPIILKGPALYLVKQQREYTPQEIRNVKD